MKKSRKGPFRAKLRFPKEGRYEFRYLVDESRWINDAEADAYAAPFPDASYKAGVRQFPELVPDHPDAPGAALSRKARSWWQTDWQGKSFMAIGVQDPVLGVPAMQYLHRQIRNCPPPLELPEAGHFVQEWGEAIAEKALVELA